jgi:hypothetical protein
MNRSNINQNQEPLGNHLSGFFNTQEMETKGDQMDITSFLKAGYPLMISPK